MNRTKFVTLVVTVVIASAGCSRKTAAPAPGTAEEPGRLANIVRTGDPVAQKQLVSGFHAIENGSWRWTQKKFEVELGVPPGAAQNGGLLAAKFTVPPVAIEKLHDQTLSASIAGTSLKTATLDAAGPFTFSREIPAALLTGPTVKVSFELDKAVPTGGADARELGVVANSFSLTPR